ncbi:MAG: HAD-IA family hydrolase [Albidovulum sp.]|uniref:HAD-IA family hydrolase n=1 Tax=Albidovulum sp. TaxID=1872424 RepID=UPI0013282704|nr:HAD-IA family hydrolase [Defluviimonas sp.]KAB2884666.1 MAG: HAD-IA family hydrolase [Defluviimonas sp.]
MTADPRLVVFDVDGTLIDSQDHILAAMDHAFAATGATLPAREAVLSIVGLSLPVAVERLVPHLPDGTRADIVAAYKASFGQLRARTLSPLFPGAAEALRTLRARPEVMLGVATGKSRRGLSHILDAHGLNAHFVTTQVADDHPSKPHPSMLLAALAETGTEAARAVMIGDTTFDIEMGLAAGMATVGVAWGYHPVAELAAAGADTVIARFDDLVPALDDLWRAA